ncbi:hypothetical protein HMPREF0663_10093 [Hoylesella oralis ATCC 33269]|uniref:Uncharacterized protein n=1 Tax=Hoylesella oralis ATCC 33269 TaxID=873533 RepID=E7RLU3_9BACT|nr:hypothetical protein HMPREF0663_10093 [Hoylesella oralis ATCC 33269]
MLNNPLWGDIKYKRACRNIGMPAFLFNCILPLYTRNLSLIELISQQ